MLDPLWLEQTLARLERLQKRAPICRYCYTDQVQLVSPFHPAQWRCRRCKVRFTYEPN